MTQTLTLVMKKFEISHPKVGDEKTTKIGDKKKRTKEYFVHYWLVKHKHKGKEK